GCDFSEHDCCAVRILIPYEVGSAESVAFLPAENEKTGILQTRGARFLFRQCPVTLPNLRGKCCLVLAKLLPDIFESGERCDPMQPFALGDHLLQVRRNKGLSDHATHLVASVQNVLTLECLCAVVRQKLTDLIAGQKPHLSLCIAKRGSHSVAIRV